MKGFQSALAGAFLTGVFAPNGLFRLFQLVVAGGVASNKYIRHELEKLAGASNANFIAPPIHLCTDNGAMIAWAGYEKYNFEGETDLNFQPRPRWPLDPDAHSNNPIFITVGKKGVKA